jgi:hypothetical protein
METKGRAGDTAAMSTTQAFEPRSSAPQQEPLPVDVHFAGRARDPSLVRFAADRMARALARFRDRVTSARVRVRDVNGRRGGIDQLCSVELALAEGGRLYLTEQADRVERALARLAQRLRRVLAERRRRHRP